jgi:MFS family permease
MTALALYSGFDSLTSLYVISVLFGLFQGGIVPSYAIIVRAVFPAQETGTRFGLVLMSTILGMAAGGWMSGALFDLTGSYRAAFLNGVAWNVLNAAIALWLLLRGRMPRPRLMEAAV